MRYVLLRPLLCVVLLLLLAGCGEDISSTRLPAGAARNFLYHLQHGELEDAMTYWAPDFTPADARVRTTDALNRLRSYETDAQKADSTHNDDGSMEVTLRGRVRPPGGTWQEDQAILRVHLIERGPGWRLTDFTLVCCP
jgi:hypothetical protein